MASRALVFQRLRRKCIMHNYGRLSYCAHSKAKSVKIGCASGFWGDTPTAAPQLIHHGNIDFLMFDYLSEITMSLLTAARAKRPEMGYAPDFVLYAVGPHLQTIKKKGIRVLSNAGGINPKACAAALQQAATKAGVDLKVAVVTGDDLMPRKDDFVSVPDMRTGEPLPKTVHSMNAYLGAGPIARALDLGADIVVTGRCADSSLALAPLIHSFGWKKTDLDLLASGSLAGHLIECGAQVTGGIFTDWHLVPDWHNIGFPIAAVSETGEIVITKPPNTGGLICKGTVSEQLLYEIGDPSAYILPDVVCDFTNVKLEETSDGVRVHGAKGKLPTDTFKVSATYLDGYKATAACCIGGPLSAAKGRRTAEAIFARCRDVFSKLKLPDFTRTHVQVLGAEDTYGTSKRTDAGPREAVIWMSVHHYNKTCLELFSREIAAAGTGMAPGLTGIVGGRPKPSPLLRLHSFLIKKNKIDVIIDMDEEQERFDEVVDCVPSSAYETARASATESVHLEKGSNRYRLEKLAYTRSGDKADSCNIGVVARHPALYPYLKEVLTVEAVASYFSHMFPHDSKAEDHVKRYEVPGINALNFVLENSLGGGGVASLRSDPQGKAYGQMLLDFCIHNMPSIDSLIMSSKDEMK